MEADEAARASYPGKADIKSERDKLMQDAKAGLIGDDALSQLAASLDFLLVRDARSIDRAIREARLAALRREFAAGETHQVQHEIDDYLDRHGLTAEEGSAERSVLANQMMRAEIEALKRTLERDEGDFGGQPSDPVVKPPAKTEELEPVRLSKLWEDYRDSRIQAGFLRDKGRRQEPVMRHLRAYLKHDDARKVTKRDLIAWREQLMTIDNLAAKTVSDIYLSTVRSVFAWAYENERLPDNVAEKVRQPKPRKTDGREKGFTDEEAVALLRASRAHVPKPNQFGFVRETSHMTAAKHWAPLLAAFTGARISEITQLRKEDIRQEGDRWIARITPDAGSVKSGGYRDVPLHRQIIALGFGKFVQAATPGPLFHGATDPKHYARAAQSVSDELGKWLRSLKLVPPGVRPNYGWRHRLKTQALELGLTMRVIDAMQGHSGRTAGENYGDVTLVAKARVIDALPDYPLTL
ncbi:site-specific recombinase XerD [Cereibacter changlensis]|uniref:Site-specific recombinase XerD n=1 Tax=Cereibacter changlensis TaxID=402884 RepID=A0A2W7RQG5_9RHOB|nr:site-specific recombinase XerD [Cereibacter changlensis]